MQQAVCRSVGTGRGYGTRRYFPRPLPLILCAGFSVVIASAAFGKPAAARQPLPHMPLDEINSREASLQGRLDSLTTIKDRVRQDSAKAAQEATLRTAGLSKKQAEFDDMIAKKKTLAAGIKNRYEKAQQDSMAIVAKNREQLLRVQKEIMRLDATVITLSNELAALSDRRDKTGAVKTGADDRAIAQLLAQAAKDDTLVRQRQSALADLSARRDRLRQDSLLAENKRQDNRGRVRAQLYQVDSLAALCDAVINQAEQKLARDRADKEQKITQAKEHYGALAKQKQGFDDKIARTNTDVSVMLSERQRLVQTSGAAQNRYDQLRAPYDKALTDAETNLQRLTKDKPLLITLRQKLRLDSAAAKARDLLDQAIQMEAENKRGAKKLVERRETALDSLQAEQNSIVSSTPGLRQKEAQLHGTTISQKTILTDNALAGIDKKIADATALRDKARSDLAAFERQNPRVQNPSGQRIAQLDTMIAAKKKDIFQMTDWSDSLNMAEQESQGAIATLTAALQAAPKTDNATQQKKTEKAALAGKRVQIQRDSVQAEAAATETVQRIRSDVAALVNQSAKTQGDIDRAAADRDRAKQSAAALQEKGRQQQASSLAEKKKYDSLVATKQQEITGVSMQSDKLRQDSVSIVKQQDQQARSLSPSPASLAGMLSDAGKEINLLQAQSDSLKRQVLAVQGRGSDEVQRVAQQMAAVNKSIEGVHNDMSTLAAQKEEAYSQLNDDKRYYDSLVAVADKELTAIVAKRDKARQDSAAADNALKQASQKVSAAVTQSDNLVTTRQKELADATAEYNRARDDSIKILYQNMGAAKPGSSQALLRSIDALITVKEKEIADLHGRVEKTGQDSLLESKRQADLLVGAHNDIKKCLADLAQRKTELELAMMVKNEPGKDGDANMKNYRELLAAAMAIIKQQNIIIDKKKADIARLQSVRDAINSASLNAPKDDGLSQLEADKRHYDSLVGTAQTELAAAISQRDKAQEDSITLDDNCRKYSLKLDTRLAVHDSMVAARQREVTDATSECNRLRDDSVKTAEKVAAALQPYRQTAKSLEALIAVKEKEMADLHARRDKANQDGAEEAKRLAEQLDAAHKEIAAKSAVVDQRKNSLTLAMAAKNDAQKSTDGPLRPYHDALTASTAIIDSQNAYFDRKKSDIARLQQVRDEISAKIKSGGKVAASGSAPADIAQKRSEEIYTLIGANKVAEASRLFRQNQAFLKVNLDKDSFDAIKMTIEQMGGSTR